MSKLIFLFCFGLLTTSIYSQQPVISSLTPATGTAGSLVTISGSNFNTTATNNIVYFGPVKASVTAAASNSLTVIVPKGASHEYISVTVLPAGLSAFSPVPFVVTFPNGADVFTASSFETVYTNNFSSGVNTNDFLTGDLDNDGRVDIAALSDPGGNSYTLTLFRNTTTNSQLSFAAPTTLSQGGSSSHSIWFADIDGDALPDLLIGCYQKITVLRNQSTPGNISFAAPLEITNLLAGEVNSIRVNDIDKDGKPDIVFTNNGAVSVIKNNSTPSNISLGNQIIIQPPATQTIRNEEVRIADFDGDQKPDLAVTYFYIDSIYTFRNLSTPGTILFETPARYPVGANNKPESLATGDINKDGKQDLLFANNDKITVYKNNSSGTNIHFTSFTGVGNLFFANRGELADLSGDETLDIVTNHSFAGASVIRNFSLLCNPAVSPRVDYGGSDVSDLVLSDITGDGKPDILIRRNSGIMILKNTHAQLAQVCSGTNTTIPSSLSGSSYQWQQNSGIGYANISNGPNLSGTNTALLQIINAPPAWNGYKFRCVVNTDTSNVYTLTVLSSVIPALTISSCLPICPGSTASFAANFTNGGAAPAFQWQDSVTIAGWTNIPGANSPTLSNYSPVASGVKIRCILTSEFSCASPIPVISNALIVNFSPAIIPSVSISTPNTVVCANANVTFTATPVNGSIAGVTFPFYQWQVNGINAGANLPTFSSSSLPNGAQVKVIMRSFATCPSPETANSNTIVMTINNAVTPVLSIGGITTVLLGQNTTLTAAPTNAGPAPSYQWQDSTFSHSWQNIAGANTNTLNYTPSQTGVKVRCVLIGSDPCAAPASVTSNVLIFTVNFVTAVNPVPGINYNIIFFPNPAQKMLYIDSLKLSDRWQTLQITDLNGKQIITAISIRNKSKTEINIERLPAGQYIAVLRKENGSSAFLKFIKL